MIKYTIIYWNVVKKILYLDSGDIPRKEKNWVKLIYAKTVLQNSKIFWFWAMEVLPVVNKSSKCAMFDEFLLIMIITKSSYQALRVETANVHLTTH